MDTGIGMGIITMLTFINAALWYIHEDLKELIKKNKNG